MISRYITFNTVKFIADQIYHEDILPSLKEQLNGIYGMTGRPPRLENVKRGPSTEGLDNIVIARQALEERIKDFESDLDKYRKAYETLTKIEKTILDLCFRDCMSMAHAEREAEERGISRSSFYRHRSGALDKIKCALMGEN